MAKKTSVPKGMVQPRYCDQCEGKSFNVALGGAAASCGTCKHCSQATSATDHHVCAKCASSKQICEACGARVRLQFAVHTLDQIEQQVNLEKVRALKKALLHRRKEASEAADRARLLGRHGIKLGCELTTRSYELATAWTTGNVQFDDPGTGVKVIDRVTSTTAIAAQVARILQAAQTAVANAQA